MAERPPSEVGEARHIRIGWREYVSLPDLGVGRLKSKIDTGARTSALHATNIEELPGDRVRFEVVLSRHDATKRIRVVAPVVRTACVRQSERDSQIRCVIRTTMRLGPVEKEIEVGLASRGSLIMRMLIGRSALQGHFLVDSGERYLMGRPGRIPRKGTQP